MITKEQKKLKKCLDETKVFKEFEEATIDEIQNYLSDLVQEHAGMGFKIIIDPKKLDRKVSINFDGWSLGMCYYMLKEQL